MYEKVYKVKSKVFASVVLLLTAMFGVFCLFEYYNYTSDIDYIIKSNRTKLFSAFKYELTRLDKAYNTRITGISARPEIMNAMRNRDRHDLYSKFLSTYRVLKSENDFLKNVHITDTNSRTIVRMHWPEFHDDDLSAFRPIVRDTNMKVRPNKGFEAGRRGLFYRVIRPVVDNAGVHYGAIEFGIRIEYLVNALKSMIPGVKVGFLVKEKELINYDRRDSLAKFGDSYYYGEDKEFMKAAFRDIHIQSKNSYIYRHDGRVYVSDKSIKIPNFVGENVIAAIVFIDVTELIDMKGKRVFMVLGLGLIMSVLVLVIIKISFNIYMRALSSASKKLENLYTLFRLGETVIMQYKYDGNVDVEYLSDNMETISGYTLDELNERNLDYFSMIHHDDLKRVLIEIKGAVHSGSDHFVHEPHRIITKTGDICWVRNRTKISRESGQTECFSYINDITANIISDREVKQQKIFLETLLGDLPVAVFYKDRNLRYLGCNDKFLDINGFESKDAVVGKSVRDLVPEVNAQIYISNDLKLFDNPEQVQVYESIVENMKTGKQSNVLFYKTAYLDIEGEVEGLIGAIVDITELKETQKKLEHYNDKLEEYFEIMDEHLMTIVIDRTGKVDYVSTAFLDVTGWGETNVLGVRLKDIVYRMGSEEKYMDIMRAVNTGQEWSGELCGVSGSNDSFYLAVTAEPEFDAVNGLMGIDFTFYDITYRKKVEELSVTDKLTQIFNRLKLDESLSAELHRSERYGNNLSVIIGDIDKFKLVNDTFGHQAGDNVLITFANLMKENVRKTDILGRWGGEEFLIICPHTDLEGARVMAENLRMMVEKTNFSGVNKVTCSFGVAEFTSGDSESSLISRADEALYDAKNNGRNRVEVCKK